MYFPETSTGVAKGKGYETIRFVKVEIIDARGYPLYIYNAARSVP